LYFLIVVSFLGAAQVSVSLPQGDFAPLGILPAKDERTLILVYAYGCQGKESEESGEVLLSSDRGKSWRSVLKDARRSNLLYVSDPAKGDLWFAGYDYEEGPASDPFVLVPRSGAEGWEIHRIYDGAAELDGVAQPDRQHLVAWLRHLKLTDKGWIGPEYVHTSVDGGRTWKQVGLAANYHGPKKGTGFTKMQKQAGNWRLRDFEEKPGGFVVERRSDTGGTWSTTAAFPARPCSTP
jgi:hypothetical protein